jgi:ADP-ribose pyrophosphatase YjhB (NUDIX family)
VVVRDRDEAVEVALIRPQGKGIWALPKGHPNPGESLTDCAAREVREETGLTATLEAPLGAIRYIYQFAGVRVLKSVTFFLFRYAHGVIDTLEPEMRQEVSTAAWVSIREAAALLAYKGEKEILRRALGKLGIAR